MKILVVKGEAGKDIWEDVELSKFGIKKIVAEKQNKKKKKQKQKMK